MKLESKEIEKTEEERQEEYEIYDDYFLNYSRNPDFCNYEFENDISSETVKGEQNNNYLEENEIPLEKRKTGIQTRIISEIKEEQDDNFKPNNNNIIFPNPINKKKINGNILENEIITEKENLSQTLTKKALGRKRKNSKEKGVHNKYCEDNIIRKIKSTILLHLLDFINSVINKTYEGEIGKGFFKKELKKISQRQIVDIKGNKLFLIKSLKEIFSDDISSKYTNFPPNQNRKIIEDLLNEEDLEKKNKFQRLFSLTFLNCLEHFRGTKTFIELEGFENYDNKEEKFCDDKEYLYLFEYYIYHFENVINRKRHRKNKIK